MSDLRSKNETYQDIENYPRGSSYNDNIITADRPYCGEGPDVPLDRRQRMRTVTIEELDYGYVVRVGCQSIAVEDSAVLIKNLIKYMENPEKVEKEWRTKKEL